MTDPRANRGTGRDMEAFRAGYSIYDAKKKYKEICENKWFMSDVEWFTGDWSHDKPHWMEYLRLKDEAHSNERD